MFFYATEKSSIVLLSMLPHKEGAAGCDLISSYLNKIYWVFHERHNSISFLFLNIKKCIFSSCSSSQGWLRWYRLTLCSGNSLNHFSSFCFFISYDSAKCQVLKTEFRNEQEPFFLSKQRNTDTKHHCENEMEGNTLKVLTSTPLELNWHCCCEF